MKKQTKTKVKKDATLKGDVAPTVDAQKVNNPKVMKLMAQLARANVIAKSATPKVQRVFPTGVDVLDHYLLGCGGFPAGERAVAELFGGEGSMKSSMVDTLIGQTQRAGVPCFIADTEHAREERRSAEVFGINWDELGNYLRDAEDPSMEFVLNCIESTLNVLPRGGDGALIVWDSFASTPTREEIKKGLEGGGYDRRAGIISRALRSITPALSQANAALVIVNQPRSKIGVAFGNPTTTPGGQAIKSTASIRMQTFASTRLKTDTEETGRLVTVVTDKSRFSARRKASLRFDYADGFNDEWSTLNLAKDMGLVPKDAKGAKALVRAIEALAKHFPGFGQSRSNPEMKAALERADKNADCERGEVHEPIEEEK